ncbi:MAG: hypothetical protein Q9166_005648 [cf. Caloplaca sp. 2 TL-2023]
MATSGLQLPRLPTSTNVGNGVELWMKTPSTTDSQLELRVSVPGSGQYCLTKPFWVEAIKNKPIVDGVGHNGDIRLADLDGNGLEDCISLASNGAMTLYINGGRSQDRRHWVWSPANGGKEITIGAGAPRDQILFADMDRDGRDDLCVIHPVTGGIILYKNKGAQRGGWGWEFKGSITSGFGGPGKNVRLADLNGDGLADIILLGPKGEATLYLNRGEKPGGWNWEQYTPRKHITEGIGFLADFVQFKDIDGDGKSDMIGIGQSDGSAIVYRNLGPKPNGWAWAPMNNGAPIASGVGTVGRDIRWGRMEKNGRHSYLALSPNSGALRAWLNGCEKLSPATGGSPRGSSSSSSSTRTATGTGTGSGTRSGSGSSSSGNSGTLSSGARSTGTPGSDSNGSRNSGQYVSGGLPIPTSGNLGSLGLPTTGFPAITSLTPYVITAENALTTAQEAILSLTFGTATAAAVAQAYQALTAASRDLNVVAQQAKGWHITSLDPGLRQQAQHEQQALQTTAKGVSDLLPRFKGCINTPQANGCKAAFSAAAQAVSSTSTMAPLLWFSLGASSGGSFGGGNGNGNGNKGSGGSGGGGGGGNGGGNGGGIGGAGSGGGNSNGGGIGGGGGNGKGSGNGGGNGANGGGNGGGRGGGSGGSLLAGGLPFPSGGLGSLGLPTSGDAAINALKPYAVTAQNTLNTALNSIKGLGAGSSAGDVSAAADSVAAAGSEYTALSDSADGWELDTFGPGPGNQIFTQVQNEQNGLKAGAKAISDRLSQLRGCVNKPGTCQNIYQTVAGALIGGTIASPLTYIITYRGTAISPTQASKVPSLATVTTTSTATPSSWVLNTVPGTSVEAYKAFIQSLPDRGRGRQMIYGGKITHAYTGTWTLDEAKMIAKNPICDTMCSNAPMTGNLKSFQINNTAATWDLTLKRSGPNIKIIRENPSDLEDVQRYQKMLSYPKNRDFRDLSDTDPHWNYAYEESAGSGAWVYTFDSGFDFDHREFAGADIEQHIAPGIRDSAGNVDTSIDDRTDGHGTSMAAAVMGFYGGVAKAAGIVGVKIASDIVPEPDDVVDAWKWAIRDVQSKPERGGKVVFNLPWIFPYKLWVGNNDHVFQYYNPPYNIPRSRYSDWMVPLLAEAWDAGIVVVASTGNNNHPIDVQGDSSPQRFVTHDNPLIVVGSADADGSPSFFNMPPGPPRGTNFDQRLQGGITVYAYGARVKAAIPGNAEHPNDNYHLNRGSSFSCSFTSGLAAYYLALPTISWPLQLDRIPQAMKRLIVNSARDGTHGGRGHVYNGVWELPCSPPSKRAVGVTGSEAYITNSSLFDSLGGHRILRRLKVLMQGML